jgi:hypothetical protein
LLNVADDGGLTVRCDSNEAKAKTEGCVLPKAAPVYVLVSAAGSLVEEAAVDVREAQNGPLNAPGKFLLAPGTRAVADNSVIANGNALQRAKSRKIGDFNRRASVSLDNSLYNTRLPLNQSVSCAAGLQDCEKDEYPFASTWNGGAFNRNRTSVKNINASHNRNAGSGNLTAFYTRERVLDFTFYPDNVSPYDPNAERNRGGDDFWVYVR